MVWLDELRDLTLRLPSSRDVVFLRMTMTGGRGGAGVIHVQGLVRDPSVVARIDRSLHDPYHAVASRRVGEQPRGEDPRGSSSGRSPSCPGPRASTLPTSRPSHEGHRGKLLIAGLVVTVLVVLADRWNWKSA